MKNKFYTVLRVLGVRNVFDKYVSDKTYLKLMYFKYFKKKLNLNHPTSFNEKLQWLKLYDRNPNYSKLVDKLLVREYIENKIGIEYLIPLLGTWDNVDDINFDLLPDKFVLKCTHDSGGIVICKDKEKLDIKEAKNKLNKSLQRSYYHSGREWPYKNLTPKIIAEVYMEDDNSKQLKDYKFFCFDGKPIFFFIASDRSTSTKFDFFDIHGNYIEVSNGYPQSVVKPDLPINLERMIKLAELLSANIPHVRVDFYEINGEVFFGELTFYHHSGFVPFNPEKFDEKFGEYINLNSENIWGI